MTAGRCSAPVCHLFCLVWAFLSETPEVFTPSSQDFVRHRGWAARSAAGGCRQAAGDEEPFTRSSDPNLAYLSAGTKVYNLCHGLNEAWGQAAAQLLSQSQRRQRKKLPQLLLLGGSAGDRDPVSNVSQGGPDLFWPPSCACRLPAANITQFSARWLESNLLSSAPAAALRPLPVFTTHLGRDLCRKAPGAAPPLPSCCLSQHGCSLQDGFEGLGKGHG